MKLVKVKVLKSSVGQFTLRAGQIRELPENVATDLAKAGHVQLLSETRENKKAGNRETATAKNQK